MQEMVDSFFYGRPRYDRNARHGLLRQLAHANFGTFAKNIAFFFHRSHRSKVSHDTRKQKEFRSFVLSSFRNSISFPEKLIKREKNSTEEFPLYSYTFDQT